MKIKYMMKESHITVFFTKKDGGPKTVTSCDENFPVVSSILEGTFFNTFFKPLVNFLPAHKVEKMTYKQKISYLRVRIHQLLESPKFPAYYHALKIYYRITEDSNRTRDKIIRDAMKYVKDSNLFDDVTEDTYVELLKNLVERSTIINKTFKGTNLSVKDGVLLYNNKKVPEYEVVKHVIKSIYDGVNVKAYVNFLDNVMKNKKASIRQELFQFLDNGDFKIHEDGTFSAYKKIRNDWKDIYTGTIDNSIGAKPTMKKSDVDDNRNNHCSEGLHFCAKGYLNSYGSSSNVRIVEVKINPKHVIAIPTDYNFMKGRCYTYEVISEVTDNNSVEYVKE